GGGAGGERFFALDLVGLVVGDDQSPGPGILIEEVDRTGHVADRGRLPRAGGEEDRQLAGDDPVGQGTQAGEQGGGGEAVKGGGGGAGGAPGAGIAHQGGQVGGEEVALAGELGLRIGRQVPALQGPVDRAARRHGRLPVRRLARLDRFRFLPGSPV